MGQSSSKTCCGGGNSAYTEDEKVKVRKTILIKATKNTTEFPYPMTLINASVLIKEGKLRKLEHLRDEGKLTVLDMEEDIEAFKVDNHIAFFSHQWLSFSEPDPDNAHYDAILFALGGVRGNLNMVNENIYLWIDYCSIPQRHRSQQQLAIHSLPAYARLAHCLIIITPDCKHKDLAIQCDTNTYKSRGWCRTEVFSKICGSGTDHVYHVHGPRSSLGMVPFSDPQFLKDALCVFDGDFTCCRLAKGGDKNAMNMTCDREKLVLPILSLYYEMLRGGEDLREFHAVLVQNKDRIFPKNIQDHMGKSQEMFGNLVEAMEDQVSNGVGAFQADYTITTGGTGSKA